MYYISFVQNNERFELSKGFDNIIGLTLVSIEFLVSYPLNKLLFFTCQVKWFFTEDDQLSCM